LKIVAKKERRKKGTFGSTKLSISRTYVFPDKRAAMIVIGSLAGLGVLTYFVIDLIFLKSSLTASGPLSSFHAMFEKDCVACHEQFVAVSNEKCSICHEKTGDELGVYTFAAHYMYRSGDRQRIQSSASAKEHPCYLCHQEHLGREAFITNVPDSRCTSCHVYGSFNKNHPQFEFVAKQIPDDSTMRFTHLRHVKEVIKREKLTDIERACLYCHNPEPDGKHFASIDFDRHCTACHLTAKMETPALRVKSFDDVTKPGVETLEMIRQRGGPGTQWAAFMNPNEFTLKSGNRLIKSPIYHEDAWVMENLRVLRRALHPAAQNTNAEFLELLKTSGPVDSLQAATLSVDIYQEAIQKLQENTKALRGRPEREVQQDLAKIDSLLKATQKRLRRQSNPGMNAKFLLPAKASADVMPAEELNFLVDDLTKACRMCHVISNAAILRVRNEQQVLRRAEFDHRAHILQRRCLECHTAIPILAQIADSTAAPKFADQSAIQNIPGIENCRQCHNAAETSNRCVTCHYFHPNKTNRSSMLLYLD
jgi:hypothetical protein